MCSSRYSLRVQPVPQSLAASLGLRRSLDPDSLSHHPKGRQKEEEEEGKTEAQEREKRRGGGGGGGEEAHSSFLFLEGEREVEMWIFKRVNPAFS